VHQALAGRIRYYGGQSLRTYLHVSDCATWLLKILDDGSTLFPYDVSGDRQISVEKLAHLVASIFEVPIDKVDGEDRIDSYFPDTYASTHLGCEQTLTIEQSLRRVHAYLCNPYQ
jgi:nucleoside-diphosphate-sugar epimerase